MSSSRSEFYMPGAYHFDNPPWPVSALGTNVYLPPTSPSTPNSGLHLDKSTASLHSDISTFNGAEISKSANTKRKRPAEDSRESTPLAEWQNMSMEASSDPSLPTDTQELLLEKLHQGRTRGSIQYTLAGQIESFDTSASGAMEDSTYSDIEYRRALGPTRLYERHEGTGRSGTDLISEPQALEHWTILHALGTVVGKVWEFCRGGPFRGFHAGGGVGYDWDTGKPVDQGTPCTYGNDASHPDRQVDTGWPKLDDNRQRCAPGGISQPDLGFKTGGHGKNTGVEELIGRRAVKRRHIGMTGEELGRNWVIVEADRARDNERRAAGTALYRRTAVTGARTPARRLSAMKPHTSDTALRRISTPVSRLGGQPSQTPRAWSGRLSHAESPRLSPHEPTSLAFSQGSTSSALSGYDYIAYSQTSSRIPVPSFGGRTSNPFARTASPGPGHRARNRTGTVPASPTPSIGRSSGTQKPQRRGRSMTAAASLSRKSLGHEALEGTIDASPRLDDEARQLAARRAVAEMDADAKMEAFNLRLQAMIRQGKEALGTAFEIDGDGEQEGWMDDD